MTMKKMPRQVRKFGSLGQRAWGMGSEDKQQTAEDGLGIADLGIRELEN
jgi:hypothetical protein